MNYGKVYELWSTLENGHVRRLDEIVEVSWMIEDSVFIEG